jgi:hypothetical protein
MFRLQSCTYRITPINHGVYKMCLVDNYLHFTVEIKAVLEERGFRPTILVSLAGVGTP